MTFWEDILAIICGVAAVDVTVILVKYLWNKWQYGELLEMECDSCQKARKLIRTPDSNAYFLCSECMPTYLTKNEYSELEKEKILNSYKKKIKHRGRRKRK